MAASKITIQRTKRTVQDHVEHMPIPFPFGIEEGCYAKDNFRLNCTPHDVTVLDRGYAQYRVSNISLDDGFLAVSNMLNDTRSNNVERLVYRNYSGAFETISESVADGIFYFSKEDETINWVVANLTCQQATQRSAMYACVSQNSHCQNVTRRETLYGYLCKCNDGFQGNPYLQNNCTGYISLLTIFAQYLIFQTHFFIDINASPVIQSNLESCIYIYSQCQHHLYDHNSQITLLFEIF